jgi:hypothetical protein
MIMKRMVVSWRAWGGGKIWRPLLKRRTARAALDTAVDLFSSA